MWQSVAEYFESTSIHGFSHLRASKTLLGRLLWILIIGSCFSLAALLICESIEEANDNPILTNIETISVQDIPFPAVTIKTPEPNIWRHFAKILNGLVFDQVRSELPEDSKLVEMISPILDQVLDIILEKFQPNEEIDPDVITAFAKIYANYLEEEIDLKIRTDLKKLLLLCPSASNDVWFSAINGLIAGYNLDFIQQYPVNESSLESSEANTKKAARTTALLRYFVFAKCSEGISNFLGFGDFLVYFKHELRDNKGLWSDNFEQYFMDFYHNVSVVKDNKKLSGLMKVNELVALLTKSGPGFNPELYMSPKAKKCILSHEFTSNVAGCHNNIEFKHAWEECCKVFSMENLDLKEVLQTMRHHSQPVTFLASERDITERENMLGKLAFDNVLSLHYLYKKRFLEENHDAMIPLCRYTNVQHMEDKFKCEEFKWSLTNAGFGITFNAADFWSIYKPTKYLKIFKEEMRPKGYSLSNQESKNENVFHTKQVGRAKDLLFIVQRSKFEETNNPFFVNMHNPSNIPNLFDGVAIPIEYGTMTTITAMPSIIESSADLQAIPLDKRNCLFESEKKLQLFKHYSQDGCMFECLLDLAYTATNCTPWDYPHLNDNQQTCNAGALRSGDVLQNERSFYELMQDSNNIQTCEAICPMDCNHLSYMPDDISIVPLGSFCGNEKDAPPILDGETEFFYDLQGMMKVYEGIVNDYDRKQTCFKTVSTKIALVKVKVLSNTVNKIIRSQRVTIAGQIANIGITFFSAL